MYLFDMRGGKAPHMSNMQMGVKVYTARQHRRDYIAIPGITKSELEGTTG